jgi:hypothetical protein
VFRIITGFGAAALLFACGPAALNLPTDPVDQAATCGVVATIQARAATQDIKAPLAFEAQEHVLHYALLAAAEGKSFSAERSNEVLRRMPELQEEISGGKWQELVPACAEAFPQAQVQDISLPANTVDARLQCDELGDFLTQALKSQEATYAARLNDYEALARNINQTLGPGLRARAGSDLQSQQEERRQALAKAARLGSPSAVMKQCVERYG